MAAETQIPDAIRAHFEIHEWKHACAILATDFPEEWNDLLSLLASFRLCRSWIVNPGGNKSGVAKFVDEFLGARGWREKRFDTRVQVDRAVMASPTHDVDCYKNKVALEVEWNNKDPFYDRDLNNFRLLFDLRAISVGIIFTRCDELQDIFNRLGRGTSYGASTTHMSKLLPRIEGGGGAGCPLLVIGITEKVYDECC
ncbi:restriction endonuclease [Parasulfuritortus cantonensis]|uniref:Restriction endonuclease n=1 Tax=Parasulfuritortus cantonensis TaxID=2528202 RepID=A0A4R1B269_9PROT|nr:BglII/BstYI family type II restriction endonuclease [Parasulfuritortus cantonensis]TCJ11520.1 restriction endonuclease [Parasulfuritortus cantonensis]